MNFAQGAFVMLGGMITYVLLTTFHLHLVVAGVFATLVVAVIGIIIERVVVRPLWDRNATMFVMILATLAVQIVIERATLLLVGDQPKSIPVFTDLPPIRVAGVSIGYQTLWIVGDITCPHSAIGIVFSKDAGRPCHASVLD